MLTPDYLKSIPENIIRLYQELENFIVGDFARRISKAGQITSTAEWQLIRAKEIGLSLDRIKSKIKETLKTTDSELDKIFMDSAINSIANDNILYEAIDKEPIELNKTPGLLKYVKAAFEQTKGEFFNMTGSLGFAQKVAGKVIYKPIAKYYQDALDFAQLQVSSGVIDYNTAIRNAVKKLCDSGIRYVDYDSGWSNKIDVAARRAVLTGVNQMSQHMNNETIEELETDIVEVTAHAGARNEGVGPKNHKSWQGKWYSISGESKEYPSLEKVTGYGTGEGLLGWGCRHQFYGVIPGISIPTYTEKELKHVDPQPFEFEGKTYTYYQATQKQRQIERNIRRTKMEIIGYKEAGLKDDFTTASIKLQRQKDLYKKFSNAAGIRVKNDRTQLYKFDKSISQKAVHANKSSKKQ